MFDDMAGRTQTVRDVPCKALIVFDEQDVHAAFVAIALEMIDKA
ncbi:hypothetical protein WBP07_25315 [Novosphingobium sp. BL-8A]